MIRKALFCFTAIFFFINITLLAQHKDSTDNRWYEFGHHDWFKFDWKFHGNPFIELNYGLSSLKHSKTVSKFADVGLAEIKLGYSTVDSFEEDVVTFKERFIFGSKLSADFTSSNTVLAEMKSNTYRIGLAKRSGYGYEIDNISILPYHGKGLVWSRIDMVDYPAEFWLAAKMSYSDAVNDTEILNRFHNDIRFGTVNEAGIRFDYDNTLSLNVAYEAAVIFPRYMFWKHLGSAIIEDVCSGLLSHFIDEVADASPYSAPIVDFLLKNGCSFLFYSLKKDKMNWPFETEAPLRYQTLKFGITVTF
jgi:hypothetical protein